MYFSMLSDTEEKQVEHYNKFEKLYNELNEEQKRKWYYTNSFNYNNHGLVNTSRCNYKFNIRR